MNDQEQKNPHHPRQVGEGVFAVTAPGQPSQEAVALFVRRPKPDPDNFTETWIYSEAYVEPANSAEPVVYQLSYFTYLSDLWDDPNLFGNWVRATLPSFATGSIKVDTHTVTRVTMPPLQG